MLVRELRVPFDADDSAIQEALMRLFNAQVQEQVRDLSESDAVEGQASRAKRSGPQGIRFSQRSVQFSLVQFNQTRVRAQAFKISSVQNQCTSIKQQ